MLSESDPRILFADSVALITSGPHYLGWRGRDLLRMMKCAAPFAHASIFVKTIGSVMPLKSRYCRQHDHFLAGTIDDQRADIARNAVECGKDRAPIAVGQGQLFHLY